MSKLTQIIFRPSQTSFGVPQPFVEDQTCLILVQKNVIKLVKYNSSNSENSFPTFAEYKNVPPSFIEEIREIIKNEYPNSLESNSDHTFLCPQNIAAELERPNTSN
ncbi:MAG: hypothetical protein AAFN93_14570 [Bacteroidota bacterium]